MQWTYEAHATGQLVLALDDRECREIRKLAAREGDNATTEALALEWLLTSPLVWIAPADGDKSLVLGVGDSVRWTLGEGNFFGDLVCSGVAVFTKS